MLPMILRVGYIAEHQHLENSVRRQGAYVIGEDELLRAFEFTTLAHGHPKFVNNDHILVDLKAPVSATSSVSKASGSRSLKRPWQR